MLVSTREATVFVKILASPAAILAGNVHGLGAICRQLTGLQLVQPLCVGIEQCEALLDRQLAGFRFASRQLYADAVASGDPFQLVPGTDAVLIGDPLGHSELELAGNLGHNPYFSKEYILTARYSYRHDP